MSMDAFRDFIYQSYSETHANYSNPILRDNAGRITQLSTFLTRCLPSDRSTRIFDFGCGDGTLLRCAESQGYSNLTGVDVSSGMISLAAERTKASLHVGNAIEFLKEKPDASYDAVFAFDVLEHMTRPELLIVSKEIYRVLAPGGKLLVHVPNGASPFCGRIRWGDLTHEIAFTATSISQLLQPIGFRELKSYEDAPRIHGFKSGLRAALWQVIRLAPSAWLAIETGKIGGHLLTQNIFVTAIKS